jgi:hypothetical protein
VLIDVAPPLALVAVTVTAEVPAGVPVKATGGTFLLSPPQPAIASKAIAAKPVASRILLLLVLVSASAIPASPISASSAVNNGGMAPGPGGRTADDRAVVVMLMVTGVMPVALTDVGLKLQVVALGRPLQAKVIAPSPPA